MRGKPTKSTVGREAGVPCKEKCVERRKEVEESREGRSSAPCKGKGVARGVKEKFMGGLKKEG